MLANEKFSLVAKFFSQKSSVILNYSQDLWRDVECEIHSQCEAVLTWVDWALAGYMFTGYVSERDRP